MLFHKKGQTTLLLSDRGYLEWKTAFRLRGNILKARKEMFCRDSAFVLYQKASRKTF